MNAEGRSRQEGQRAPVEQGRKLDSWTVTRAVCLTSCLPSWMWQTFSAVMAAKPRLYLKQRTVLKKPENGTTVPDPSIPPAPVFIPRGNKCWVSVSFPCVVDFYLVKNRCIHEIGFRRHSFVWERERKKKKLLLPQHTPCFYIFWLNSSDHKWGSDLLWWNRQSQLRWPLLQPFLAPSARLDLLLSLPTAITCVGSQPYFSFSFLTPCLFHIPNQIAIMKERDWAACTTASC